MVGGHVGDVPLPRPVVIQSARGEPRQFYVRMAYACAVVAFVGFTPTYWAPVATQRDTWATQTIADKIGPVHERQTNVARVKRSAHRIAIVRAIHWGPPRRHVQKYLDAFQAASDRCLEIP